eukprot:CAMPEP_0184397262 /NCGR_PEP_ID=MMETSP0007-20130409/58906_1 /TAXON_ID=97485 /ORGANISM="Prymnesium parvum, Strain Texoma1" /LENGTH=32 /DNA_ID= /DNA_START= /DNA_END= /DNA_ORIENTATION=
MTWRGAYPERPELATRMPAGCLAKSGKAARVG